MFNVTNGKVTPSQILMPVTVLAFVVFVLLGAQFFQNMRDRDGLHQAKMQQEKAFEDAMHVQEQLNALAVGTKQLADKGDKDAKAIIDRMNKLGIKVNAPPGAGMPMGNRAPAGRAPMGSPPPPPPEEAPADR